MEVILHRTFLKDFDTHPKKIRVRFVEQKNLFLRNPHAPTLNNHKLNGEYAGCRSINITGDIRAIFYLQDDMAVFIRIGTHAELYE